MPSDTAAAGVWGAPESMLGVARGPECPLCKAVENREAFYEHGYSLRQCAVCELFFIHPYPHSAAQHRHVTEYDYDEIEVLDTERSYAGEVLYYRRHFPQIAEECGSAQSLLDVGCGTGHLLERLRELPGLYRAGIELNAQRAAHARQVAGCQIHETALEEFRGRERFDVITMINVLSHIPSFDRLFESVRRLLQPGGKLILRTSEMGPGVHRWSQLSWGIPDDLHFLGLGSLDFICRQYGFGILRRERIPYSHEFFLPARWKQPGRSRLRNMLKTAGVKTPFALPALKKFYERMAGTHLFLSFVVLRPEARSQPTCPVARA